MSLTVFDYAVLTLMRWAWMGAPYNQLLTQYTEMTTGDLVSSYEYARYRRSTFQQESDRGTRLRFCT
jgi:hypothetical protein